MCKFGESVFLIEKPDISKRFYKYTYRWARKQLKLAHPILFSYSVAFPKQHNNTTFISIQIQNHIVLPQIFEYLCGPISIFLFIILSIINVFNLIIGTPSLCMCLHITIFAFFRFLERINPHLIFNLYMIIDHFQRTSCKR